MIKLSKGDQGDKETEIFLFLFIIRLIIYYIKCLYDHTITF